MNYVTGVKFKVFTVVDSGLLEYKLNSFLITNPNVEIVDVKLSTSKNKYDAHCVTVLIVYKESLKE